MALHTQEKQIGESVYVVTQLPAMRALKLSARISRVVGPAMAKAVPAGGKGAIDVGGVAQALFDRLDPDELEKILRELLGTATTGGQAVMETFDIAFAGKLEDAVALVAFALQVQFGTLFTALVSAAASLGAQPAESGSTSPAT